MNSIDILKAVQASPELTAMAKAAPPDLAGLAAALSAGRTKVQAPFMVSARGLAGKFSGGPLAAEVVLMKLEGARDAMLASTDQSQQVMGSLLRRQLGFLAGEGLDFGDATLRGMLDQFGALGIITVAEAGHLKALAEVPDVVTPRDVDMAIKTDDGQLRV